MASAIRNPERTYKVTNSGISFSSHSMYTPTLSALQYHKNILNTQETWPWLAWLAKQKGHYLWAPTHVFTKWPCLLWILFSKTFAICFHSSVLDPRLMHLPFKYWTFKSLSGSKWPELCVKWWKGSYFDSVTAKFGIIENIIIKLVHVYWFSQIISNNGFFLLVCKSHYIISFCLPCYPDWVPWASPRLPLRHQGTFVTESCS